MSTEHTEYNDDHTEREVGVEVGWRDPAEPLEDEIVVVVDPADIPIANRWWKWRMWFDQDDHLWMAAQPFQIVDPMFRRRTNDGETVRLTRVAHPSAHRVLAELQCAILIAEAEL